MLVGFLGTAVALVALGSADAVPAIFASADEADLMRALRAGSLDAVAVELDAGESYAPPRGTTDVPSSTTP